MAKPKPLTTVAQIQAAAQRQYNQVATTQARQARLAEASQAKQARLARQAAAKQARLARQAAAKQKQTANQAAAQAKNPNTVPPPPSGETEQQLAQQQQIGLTLPTDEYQQLAPAPPVQPSNYGQFYDPAVASGTFVGPYTPQAQAAGWQDIGFSQLRHDLTEPVPVPRPSGGVALPR